jgi:hypothetical protein
MNVSLAYAFELVFRLAGFDFDYVDSWTKQTKQVIATSADANVATAKLGFFEFINR